MNDNSLSYVKKAAVVLLFVVLALLYFYPVLDAENIFTERDLSAYFIPPRALWVSLVKSFEIPLWNPHNSSGIPLLATLQPGVVYPPHIFYFVFPFNVAWNWIIILHFVFAGISVYVFLRYLKASEEASIAGGIVFMLSGYLFSVHSLLSHLLSVPWVPLVMMAFLKAIELKRLKYIALTAILLAMEFFAGAPEIVLINVLLLMIVTGFPDCLTDKSTQFVARIKTLLAVGVIFLMLCSIQLFPFYELKLSSIRHSGLSYSTATMWSFAWRDFLLFFMPDFYGYFSSIERYWTNQSWLKTVYLGIIPFVFSLFYFVTKDGKRWFFLSLFIVSFALALGGNTPLYRLLYDVPPFNSIRYPVKFLFLFVFLFSVTSGLGVDSLARGVVLKEKRIVAVIHSCFYFGFLLAISWCLANVFETHFVKWFETKGIRPNMYNQISFNLHNLKRLLFFSFMFLIMLLIYFRSKNRKVFLFVLISIMTVDLFLANQGFYFSYPWKSYKEDKSFVSDLRANKETERYLASNRTNEDFMNSPTDLLIGMPHYAALYGLYTTGGVEVMKVAHHDLFLKILNDRRSISEAKRFFDISGVKNVITSFEIDNPDFGLVRRLDVEKKNAYLYYYKRYPGRFLLFSKVRVVNNDQAGISKLLDQNIDLRKQLIILSNDELDLHDNGTVTGKVTLSSYTSNKIELISEADRQAFLYVSDTYYPGWRAYVDGRRTKIYRANLAFRAVQVPKGKHTVVFKYVPMSFYIGLFLTCIGIVLCIFLSRRKDRDTKPEERSP